MSMEIWFSQLVKVCGKPETMILWSRPETNPAFKKAKKENRILTVIQRHKGAKDFGLIGFIPQPLATYLVFPKKLPSPYDDTRVIGIKYDLLEVPVVDRKAAWTPPKKKEQVRPVTQEFQIVVVRTATDEITFTIAAPTKQIAAKEGLKLAEAEAFNAGRSKIQNTLKSVKAV